MIGNTAIRIGVVAAVVLAAWVACCGLNVRSRRPPWNARVELPRPAAQIGRLAR